MSIQKTFLAVGIVFLIFCRCQPSKTVQTFDASKCKTYKDELPEFEALKGIKQVEEYDFCHEYSGESKLLIINNEEAFLSAISAGCTDVKPNINFASNTLLAFYMEGGGCEVKFKRKVVRKNKTYTYYVKTEESGSCEMMVYNMNWVLIPKLKPDEEVLLKTGRRICREF